MPHELMAGSPEDWLRHARADLAIATAPLPKYGLYSTLCFHAQQAAEKSIKAVLVSRTIAFPKVHSLARLIDLLPVDVERTPVLLESARLTVYATDSRYPGEADDQDVPDDEYQATVHLAEAVFKWASDLIKRRMD